MRPLEHLRGTQLLLVVILITYCVRPGHNNDDNANNDAETLTENLKDDVDPCSVYESCSSCTFAKFRASRVVYQPSHPQSPSANNRNRSLLSSFSSSLLSLFDWRRKAEKGTLKTTSRLECRWCIHSGECYSPSWQPNQYCTRPPINNTDIKKWSVDYEYDCPLGPVPYPDDPPTLLPNWMGAFYQAGILDHVTLTDLSLPGSHDSLSYDLSLTVSTDGIDHLQRLAELLHTLSGGMIHFLPGDLEEFFRMQGKTQQLTLPQQLDNGIRFLDFRIMFEPDKDSWYSIHFMQSKQPAEDYLSQIRDWMDAHPHEVLVIWLSKHGSTDATGQSAYPGVSPEQKHQFWDKYTAAFRGMMQNTHETSIFTSSLAELIDRNHRIVSFVSDYEEFTDSSKYAMNANKIQNEYDEKAGVFDEVSMLQSHINYFKQAATNNAQINSHHGFTLLAMNTASPSWQVLSAAERIFLHWMLPYENGQKRRASHYTHLRAAAATHPSAKQTPLGSMFFHSCSHHIKIPGVTHWCPENLLDISQLTSFYNQIAIEEAYLHSFALNEKESSSSSSPPSSSKRKRPLAAFPNAFYLDALDYDGTIRTGPQLLDGTERGDMANNDTLPNKAARYALVDTILDYNARIACNRRTNSSEGACEALRDRIYVRRKKYPLHRWEEPSLGRHTNWPPYKFFAGGDDDSDIGTTQQA